MKICFINPGFNLGGAEKVTIELSNLMANKHEVTLIDFSGINYFYYEVDPNVNIQKVIPRKALSRKIISRSSKILNKTIKKPYSIKRTYKENIKYLIHFLKENKHDVVVLSQGELTAVIPELKKELPKQIMFAWQHNDYDIYVNQYCKPFLNDYLDGLRLADQVICLTKTEKIKYSTHNKSTEYIYNPLTIKTNRSNTKEKNFKRILFSSRMSINQKGLDLLISIAKKVKTESFVIDVAGDGVDLSRFKQMVSKENLEDKFSFLGRLNEKEMMNFYESGQIFISTSRWEGFGLVITEAMQMGLPIISFKNKGPSEILDDGRYGVIVENYDLDDFALQIDNLLENQEKRRYYRSLSLKRATDFSGEQISNEWNILFNKYS